MAFAGIIFPSHVYGILTDKFGVNITAYNTAPNTTGFPSGSGLVLGTFGLLFDGTLVKMLRAAGNIAANDAVSISIGNSNDYRVIQTPATADVFPVQGVSDRVGAALVSGDFAWMTIYGLATANCAAGIVAPQALVSSAVAGRLAAATAGVSIQSNIVLLNTTVAAGNYPVFIG